MVQVDDIVTVKLENPAASNTYIVDTVIDDHALLKHPLFPRCLVKFKIEDLNRVSPNVKDSIERSLDFASRNKQYLDYNTCADLEALCMYFVFCRKLTPRQKSILSNICGTIASIKLDNDINAAMESIKENAALLDEFNSMWYRNFNGLFSGTQPITSKKQRAAIFNIAGFVLAELETPTASR